jgi:hypothetical protein
MATGCQRNRFSNYTRAILTRDLIRVIGEAREECAVSQFVAFAGNTRVASGGAAEVAAMLRLLAKAGLDRSALVFDATTGRQVDLDPRLSDAQLATQFAAPGDAGSGRGRPKLGVVPREVTLLPRHWEWLGRQRGGASATLRRLVDDVRRDASEADARREAREAVHRFITAIAGNAPGYEEAVRALFVGDGTKFHEQIAAWPDDIREQASQMAQSAFPAPSPLAGLVPPERLAGAVAAVRGILGDAPINAEPLAGRSGATILKISGPDRAAVLRCDVPPDGFRDPARHYACHAIAAQAGVAPQLLHVNLPERLALSAFVESSDEMTPDQRLAAVGHALAQLHRAPLFPPLMPFMQAMDGLVTGFAALGLLPDDAIGRLRARFEALRDRYDMSAADLVASHNDLNPTNILYGGGRAHFVDWETAFAADRYVDLAAVVNVLARSKDDEALILRSYFGRAPTEAESGKLNLMRQVSRLYYGIMLLRAAARSHPGLQLGETAIAVGADGSQEARHPVFEVNLGCRYLAEALRGEEHP